MYSNVKKKTESVVGRERKINQYFYFTLFYCDVDEVFVNGLNENEELI